MTMHVDIHYSTLYIAYLVYSCDPFTVVDIKSILRCH